MNARPMASRVFVVSIVVCMLLSVGGGQLSVGGDGSVGGGPGTLFQSDFDVYVEKIDVKDYQVVTGITSQKHYPGQAVQLEATLWNLGTKSISAPFGVLMVIVDDVSEADVLYETHLRRTITSLGAGTSTTVNFSWLPPESAPPLADWDYEEDGSHKFGIRAISLFENDGDSSNNFATGTVDIYHPNFQLDITNLVWTPNGIIETPTSQRSTVGAQLKLEFTVNETLNTNTNYVKVELYDMPDGWAVMPGTLPNFVEVKIGSGATLSPTVLVSRDNKNALMGTDHFIKIRAYSLFSPPISDTFMFTVNIAHNPGALFNMPKDLILKPGTHLVDVKLQNTGNGPDNFLCGAYPFPASKNWKAAIYSGLYTRVLQPGDEAAVTIEVVVPKVTKNAGKSIVVTARSTQSTDYITGVDQKFKIFVDEYSSAALRLSDDVVAPLHLLPAAEYAFDVILTDDGNFKDSSVNARVEFYPEGWEVTLDTSQVPKNGLTFGSETDIDVLVKTPAVVAAGTYSIELAGVAGDPAAVHDLLEIPVEIVRMGNVALAGEPSSRTGSLGDTVHYSILIKNTGNHQDVFDLGFEYGTEGMDGWNIKLSEDQVYLEPNTTHETILTVTIPFDAISDTDPRTITVSEGYSVIVIARSQQDFDVEGAITLVTNVEPFYDFVLSTEQKVKPVISGIDDGIPFIIDLENRGNSKDTYEFLYTGEYSWTRLLARYKTVPAGEVSSFKFEANPPADLEEGVYEFTVNVRSLGEIELYRDITLRIFVGTLELSITGLLVNGVEPTEGKPFSIDGGSKVLITATVMNTGSLPFDNVSFNDCLLNFFDGRTTIDERYITYLPAGSELELSVEWTAPLVDSKFSIFVNIDPYEDIPFTDRDDHDRSVNIVVYADDSESSTGRRVPLSGYMVPVLMMIIVVIVQSLAIMAIRRIRRSRFRAGYTEDGEYKPYGEAWTEAMPLLKGKKRLKKMPKTNTINVTKPVATTIPLEYTKPLLKLKD